LWLTFVVYCSISKLKWILISVVLTATIYIYIYIYIKRERAWTAIFSVNRIQCHRIAWLYGSVATSKMTFVHSEAHDSSWILSMQYKIQADVASSQFPCHPLPQVVYSYTPERPTTSRWLYPSPSLTSVPFFSFLFLLSSCLPTPLQRLKTQ